MVNGKRVWLGLLLAGLAVPSGAGAERPAAPKLLPDRTLVLVRIHDANDFAERMSDTSIGKMSADPELRPLLKHLYGSAAAAFVSVEKEIGLSLNDVARIPQGEVCFAMIDSGQGNQPGVMLLMDCGERIKDAQRIIDRLLEEAAKNGETIRTEKIRGTELTAVGDGALAVKDGAVMFASSKELAVGILDVWDGELKDISTLADNKSYSAIMKQCAGAKGERPQMTFFVDPLGIAAMATRGNLSALASMALLQPLGIQGLEGIGGSAILGGEEFESILHAHLLLKDPREGVLKMVAMKSGDTAPESWVPDNVASYSTMHWDVQQTYRALETLFDTIRGEGQFGDMLDRRVGMPLEVNFQKEMIGQLAGRASMISWIEPSGLLNSESTLIGVELKDPEQMQDTLNHLAKKFPDSMMPDAYAGVSFYRLPSMQNRRRRRPQDESQPPAQERPARPIREGTPSVAVVGDYLLVTDNRRLLEVAVDTRRNGKSLADDLEFKLVEGKIHRHLRGVEPGMLQFNRPEENFKALYALASSAEVRGMLGRQSERGNAGARAIAEALEENPLPPFSVLSKYLAPGGAMISDGPAGLHYTGFSLRRDSE